MLVSSSVFDKIRVVPGTVAEGWISVHPWSLQEKGTPFGFYSAGVPSDLAPGTTQ